MRITRRMMLDAMVGLAIIINFASAIVSNRNQVEPAADCEAPAGDALTSIRPLQSAADQGNVEAQWKLGRMYAIGNGVLPCDLRAFDYFSLIANGHPEDYLYSPQAFYVANAFVALGQYYLDGIPNSQVKADPHRAREMFCYAASYFGNAVAEYYLTRIYLAGRGVERSPPLEAAHCLAPAFNQGRYHAQAMVSCMLDATRGSESRPDKILINQMCGVHRSPDPPITIIRDVKNSRLGPGDFPPSNAHGNSLQNSPVSLPASFGNSEKFFAKNFALTS